MKGLPHRRSLVSAIISIMLAGTIRADPPDPAPEVAFFNLATVFQQYEKAKVFKRNIEEMIGPLKIKREQLAKDSVKNEREIEDLEREMRRILGQKNEKQYIELYKDVTNAAEAYAKAKGIQAILGYVEPTQGDPFGSFNISRKLQGLEDRNAVVFSGRKADVTAQIVAILNQAYRNKREIKFEK